MSALNEIRTAGPPEFCSQNGSLRGQTIHEIFEQQAAATPDATAVVFEDQEVSYAELNRRANRLADHLRHRGVVRGDLIGLCINRSPEMIVGLLGILKAGGAYVPLDPAYPDERLDFMLRDTAAPWILTHRPTTERMALLSREAGVLCLDSDASAIASESDEDSMGGETAADLAYVMYTSGSTGKPKGILVTHQGVVRLVRETDYCQFGPDEVFLHLAPLAFDASTFEIWGPLLNGGRLVILPPNPPSLDELGTAIRRHGITTLWLTAGLFHLVVEQCVEILEPLRQLIAGGDVLSPKHVSRALSALKNGVLINGYGPTESTTFASCFRMNRSYQAGSTIPIGRPIAKTTIHVLDERLQPVPVGLPGEMFIGGDGLARGYLNNPELTQERFVPDPFSTAPFSRLYRTGDRGRLNEKGDLEFLGRLDNQVKILGYRIEPDEIEATLQEHPSVRQSVVVVHSPKPGENQLVAFVVADKARDFSADQLRRFLIDRLPSYMVPSRIVRIDAVPLNGNGKIDRSGLSVPERPMATEIVPEQPRSHLEKKLTSLWSRILGCGVGLDENFFDLDGTSLQLIEMHAELTKMFGKQISVTKLFEHTTVRSLAGLLSGNSRVNDSVNDTDNRARQQKEAFARRKAAKRSAV